MNLAEYLKQAEQIMATEPDPLQQLLKLESHREQHLESAIANSPQEMLDEIQRKSAAQMKQMEQDHDEKTRKAVLARAQYYWCDVEREIGSQLPHLSYQAFAATCAERLLHEHLTLPADTQRPFTQSCRAPLDCLWDILAGAPETARLRSAIESWHQNYLNSPLNHDLGQEGPGDADHSPATAVIYAVECFLESSPQKAQWTMGRVIEEAMNKATESLGHATISGDEYVEECAHSITQQELRWLKSLTAALSRPEHDVITLRSLAKAFVE
jgi:hypothetical protein